NGTPVPLLYASPGQVNAQVPYETKVGTAKVIVTSTGVSRGRAEVRGGDHRRRGAVESPLPRAGCPRGSQDWGPDRQRPVRRFGAGLYRTPANQRTDPRRRPHGRAILRRQHRRRGSGLRRDFDRPQAVRWNVTARRLQNGRVRPRWHPRKYGIPALNICLTQVAPMAQFAEARTQDTTGAGPSA